MRRGFDLLMAEADPAPEGGGGGTASLVDPNPAPAEAAPEQSPDAPTLPEWLTGVDPELASHASLKPVGDINTLVKNYINAQKMIGKNQIAVPDEFATPEDWRKVMEKIGLPAEKDKYNVEFGETELFNDDFKSSFKELAYEHGVLPKQAQEMFNFINAQTEQAVKTQEENYNKVITEEFDKLKNEWGAGFDKELKTAQVALRQFADDNMLTELQESGLDTSPTLIRLLNKIGKGLNEDTFDRKTVGHLGTTKVEAEDEIGNMMGDSAHPYWNGQHPNHKSAVDRMIKLREIVASGQSQA